MVFQVELHGKYIGMPILISKENVEAENRVAN